MLKLCVCVLFLGTPGGTAAHSDECTGVQRPRLRFELNYKLHFQFVSRQTLPFAFRTLVIYNYYMTCLYPLKKKRNKP